MQFKKKNVSNPGLDVKATDLGGLATSATSMWQEKDLNLGVRDVRVQILAAPLSSGAMAEVSGLPLSLSFLRCEWNR